MAYSKPTEEDWQSTSTLLPHDALPDSHSVTSNAKSAAETGTDFFDRGLTSRTYALAGVACSSVVSCCCIIAGTVVLYTRGSSTTVEVMTKSSKYGSLQSEMLVLTLNLIVTLCTESIGVMHSISLRSALASESRLSFSTNLRLITATRGRWNPNSALLNGLMAVLLTISYSSATFVVFTLSIAGFPLLVLGIALLLQVAIALAGMRAVKILTWSSSPFDLTAALVHHTQLTPASFRCMRSVSDLNVAEGPAKPSEEQPSAWRAHPSIRKVVFSLWGLVVACAGWATIVRYKQNVDTKSKSWSFLDRSIGYSVAYTIGYSENDPSFTTMSPELWILAFVNIAVVQGSLTLGLHCSDLIANVIQNEWQWRCATARKGLNTATNPLKAFLTNPLGLVLFVLKPVLHWMFGLALTIAPTAYVDAGLAGYAFMGTNSTAGLAGYQWGSMGNSSISAGQLRDSGDSTVPGISVLMCVNQILNLCIALFIFASFFTLVALRRPRGPQPATYGHLQTLANLVDEWSSVMWWGHKEDGPPYCHAGTSDHPLPDVKMDCVYAGSGVVSIPLIPGEAPALEK